MIYDYIGTYSNKKYHFLNPSIDEVCIEDIARALSMNCRFSGHISSFYSVAEHSCIIADIILRETGDLGQALSALLHDASEAYLTDVPRPIKPYLNGYSEIERKAELIIQQKFNIKPMSKRTKYIDTHIVGIEAKLLFKHVPEWASDFDHVDIKINSWSPKQAKRIFLDKFTLLSEAIKNA